jgi:hypothetical protein
MWLFATMPGAEHHFQKLPKVRNHPMVKNSPNLVTLQASLPIMP